MNISTVELLDWLVKASYLVAATLFLLGLQRMASPLTARSGIRWAGLGMLLATAATFFLPELHNVPLIDPVPASVHRPVVGTTPTRAGRAADARRSPQTAGLHPAGWQQQPPRPVAIQPPGGTARPRSSAPASRAAIATRPASSPPALSLRCPCRH